MNAIALEILLHCFWSGEEYRWVKSETESKAKAWLIDQQLLKMHYSSVEITERGRVHIKSLLAKELPLLKWVA